MNFSYRPLGKKPPSRITDRYFEHVHSTLNIIFFFFISEIGIANVLVMLRYEIDFPGGILILSNPNQRRTSSANHTMNIDLFCCFKKQTAKEQDDPPLAP